MSLVSQGSPTVLVPYLIRPKMDCNTVSTDSGSWDDDWVRTREAMSCPVYAFPSQSVDLVKLLGLPLFVDYMQMRDNPSRWLFKICYNIMILRRFVKCLPMCIVTCIFLHYQVTLGSQGSAMGYLLGYILIMRTTYM